jgi:hypothetical protein
MCENDRKEKGRGRNLAATIAVFLVFAAIIAFGIESRAMSGAASFTTQSIVDYLAVTPTAGAMHSSSVDQSMTFITLTYGTGGKSSKAPPIILHNCMMIKQSKGNNSFIIYTDRPDDNEFCKYCQCEKFELYNCKCPVANCTGIKNACEKNHFFSDMMVKYPEFVFVDHDLVIVKQSFFAALYARTRQHDFLAARDQGPGLMLSYKKPFNSGLVFIRRIPSADPMLLREYLYTKNKVNYDQNTLSTFVHLHYDNWDELSSKWHCRRLLDTHPDIPLTHCYTLHPPNKVHLKKLNFTFLTP